MINICNNQNLNNGLNYFIMQSNENVEKFLDTYSQYNIDGETILENLNLSREDFTDCDWKRVCEYL